MNRFLLIFAFLAASITLFAQEDAEVKKKINDIKRNAKAYIYASGVGADQEKAYSNAVALLEVELDEWARQNGREDATGLITQISEQMLKLESRRGSQYQAFVYVKRSDILAYTDSDKLMVVPMKQDDRNNDVPMVQANSEGNVEIPLTEEPQTAKPQTAKPQTPQTANSSNRKTAKPQKPQTAEPQTDAHGIMMSFIEDMKDVKNLEEVKRFIAEKYEKYGKRFEYDTFKKMPAEGNLFLFLYNRQNVVTCRIARETGNYIDLDRDEILMSLSDRKADGAIWFRYK